MGKEDKRRAKVTPETKAEAVRLRKLWDERSHPTQAEFGDAYGIGNQSAVGQFLRGDTPLSLKAARGFAIGLQCNVEDFSPRLAAEAASIARMVPSESLSIEAASIAAGIDALPAGEERDRLIRWCRDAIEVAAAKISSANPASRQKKQASGT